MIKRVELKDANIIAELAIQLWTEHDLVNLRKNSVN